MLETLAALPLIASSALWATYWICLIVGGGLLLISMLSAGGDHAHADFDTHAGIDTDVHGDVGFDSDADFDADVSGDVDADLPGHVEADVTAAHEASAAWDLSTWLSVRFIVFFMAIFGGFGVTLSSLTEMSTWTVFAIALAAGLVVGQGAHQIIRAIKRGSGDSTPQPHDYVNRLARVTIAITPPRNGQIALQVRNAERYIPADAAGCEFNIGDEVVVTGYRAGVARVVSRSEYERRARSG